MKRIYSFTLILITLFLITLALPNFLRSGRLPNPVGWEEYRIKKGDTLWCLAQKIISNQDGEYNLQEVVFLIAEKNNFKDPGDLISPGEEILLPIFFAFH